MIAAGFENMDASLLRDLFIIATALVGLALGIKKLFFEPKLSDKYATVGALAKLDIDVQAQLKEMRAYVHEMVHTIRGDIHLVQTSSDVAREGIHDRLNALVQVTYLMKGLIDASMVRERGPSKHNGGHRD